MNTVIFKGSVECPDCMESWERQTAYDTLVFHQEGVNTIVADPQTYLMEETFVETILNLLEDNPEAIVIPHCVKDTGTFSLDSALTWRRQKKCAPLLYAVRGYRPHDSLEDLLMSHYVVVAPVRCIQLCSQSYLTSR